MRSLALMQPYRPQPSPQPLVYFSEKAPSLRNAEVVAPSPQHRSEGLGYHLNGARSPSLGQFSELLPKPFPTLGCYLNPTA